jgi:hypothetical protein
MRQSEAVSRILINNENVPGIVSAGLKCPSQEARSPFLLREQEVSTGVIPLLLVGSNHSGCRRAYRFAP